MLFPKIYHIYGHQNNDDASKLFKEIVRQLADDSEYFNRIILDPNDRIRLKSRL
jgi:hypothetical protein